MSLLLRNVHWFNGTTAQLVPQLVIDAEGARPDDHPPVDATEIAAEGCWLLPALAELHADFRQPGLEHIYTFEQGVQAMLRGGFSTALLSPQTDPIIDHPSEVELVRRKVEMQPVDLRIAAALSLGLQGKKLPEMVEMHRAGATAFSSGLAPLPSTRFLRLILSYASLAGCRVHFFPMEPDWAEGVSVPEGGIADLYGLPSRPECAETIAVFRLLEAAKTGRTPVHIKHLTVPASIEMVARARLDGVDVTCDTPLLHLAFDEEDLDGLNTALHLVPPLRSKMVRAALLELVKSGAVDALSSQHIPVLPENKNDHFTASHPGAVGLETAFALAVELLGGFSEATVERAVELFSHGPRRVLGLPPAAQANEWMLWDPSSEHLVSKERFAGVVQNSPLVGKTVRGHSLGVAIAGGWHQVGG